MSAVRLLAIPGLASLALYVLAWCLVVPRLLARRRAAGPPPGDLPGLSILKPLCGLDEGLEANLASFLDLDHEPLQIVFGVADPFDPALALVRKLVRARPPRDVAIVVGRTSAAASPKVALLEALLPHARHPIVLLSDSNVRLAGHEQAAILPLFADPDVGMVYQPVVARGERTVAAAIENLHYTEYAAFLTIAINALVGQHTVNAKGMWLRRATLDALDGFATVRDSGADDYELGRQVQAAGWGLVPAALPVTVVQRDWSWRSLLARNLRHAGLRLRICPLAYPCELLVNPVAWALPLLAFPGWAPLVVAVVVLKLALELSAARLLRGTRLPPRFVPVALLKDLVIFACWFVAPFQRTACWRDRTYRLLAGGRIEPVPGAAAAPAGALETAA
jgi:ceramide glucosyltransferase